MAKYKATPKNMKDLLKLGNLDTQKELAEKAGVKEATISRFDKQARYDIDVLVSVSMALGKRIEDLFDIEEVIEEGAE
ncbi:helix-turn-helix domain-containing protein [Niallia sp. Krafla_26]|uniref:helix-turn-helix domain-containing protein n=1 Tax=Niallia sp. Krafla_26 TaxID=3064703 RepID=UPI003D169DC1